jgi:hypothetical protein
MNKELSDVVISFSVVIVAVAVVASVSMYYAVSKKGTTLNSTSVVETKEITASSAVITDLNVHKITGQSPIEFFDDIIMNLKAISGATSVSCQTLTVASAALIPILKSAAGVDALTLNSEGKLQANFYGAGFLQCDVDGHISSVSLPGGGNVNTSGAVAANGVVVYTGAGGNVVDSGVTIGTSAVAFGARTLTTSGTVSTGALSSASTTIGVFGLSVDVGSTGAVSLGTGSGARTVTIGSSAGNSATNINAGTGNLSLTTSDTGLISINPTGTGAINIGTDVKDGKINIGTFGTRAVAIGNVAGTISLAANVNMGDRTLTTTGTLSTGALTASSASITGLLSANGGIALGTNVMTSTGIVSTGALTASSASITGLLSANGGIALGTNAMTSTGIVSTGALTAASASITGLLSANGGIALGTTAMTSTGTVSTGALTAASASITGLLNANGGLALGGTAMTSTGTVSTGALTAASASITGLLSANGGIALGANSLTSTGTVSAITFTGNLNGNMTNPIVSIGGGNPVVTPVLPDLPIDNPIQIGANSNIRGTYAVAIGQAAGAGDYSVCIGYAAGQASLRAASAVVCIGLNAGNNLVGANSVNIGNAAGNNISGADSVNIGTSAGATNAGIRSINIGNSAGLIATGTDSINIGTLAANTAVPYNNSIVINATGISLPPLAASSFYVKPIRPNTQSTDILHYDVGTGEIKYMPYVIFYAIESKLQINNTTTPKDMRVEFYRTGLTATISWNGVVVTTDVAGPVTFTIPYSQMRPSTATYLRVVGATVDILRVGTDGLCEMYAAGISGFPASTTVQLLAGSATWIVPQ